MLHAMFTSLSTILSLFLVFFFFNDTATTEIYTLSLHDALPISRGVGDRLPGLARRRQVAPRRPRRRPLATPGDERDPHRTRGEPPGGIPRPRPQAHPGHLRAGAQSALSFLRRRR